MDTNCRPAGKNYRLFQEAMAQTTMTPQQRTTYNAIIKQYEAMMAIDYKTQDRYEQDISLLKRDNDRLVEQLRIANQVIHQAEDEEEETPAPLLHMMERCSAAEKKYDDLVREVLACSVDCPDVSAFASLAHQLHKAQHPNEKDQIDEKDLYTYLVEDVCEKEDLTGEADFGDAFDNGFEAGKRDMEEEIDAFLDDFDPLMSRITRWERDASSWGTQLKDIQERMEHHILCQERAETDCENWEERCVKGEKKSLEDKFQMWRELQCAVNPQYSVDDEVGFLLGEDPYGVYAKDIFDELYPGQFILDVKGKTYQSIEELSDEDE